MLLLAQKYLRSAPTLRGSLQSFLCSYQLLLHSLQGRKDQAHTQQAPLVDEVQLLQQTMRIFLSQRLLNHLHTVPSHLVGYYKR